VPASAATPLSLWEGKGLESPTRRRITSDLLAFVFFLVVTCVYLWPLPARMGSLVIPNEDVYGNSWALAWVVRQLTEAPFALFDANIFHPVPQALAFTEPLLPQALQASPILLAGGSPLLAHNFVLLLSFPLSAFGVYLLAAHVSGSRIGGCIAGLGYAFCSYRFAHLVHVQSLSMQWLPLALLFLLKALARPTARVLAGLFTFSLLQALSSGYYAVVLGLAAASTLAWHARDAQRRGTLLPTISALAVAAVFSILVFLPYRFAIQRESELRGYTVMRSPEEMIRWSASWSSYLDPGPNTVLPTHRFLDRLFWAPETLFVGVVVLVLASVAVVRGRRVPEVRWGLVLVAVGVLFSLGPRIQLPGVEIWGPLELVRRLPPFTSLRTPSRYGVLAILALDLLAALGWSMLPVVWRRRAAFPALLLVLLELAPGSRPDSFQPDPPAPPTASWLATAPRGVVLELPWDHDTHGQGARYVYWSTVHWQRMVNGWGGVYPLGPFELGVSAKRFPSPDSSRELRRAGVRYVVVHLAALPGARRARIEATSTLPEGVFVAATLGTDLIYEISALGPLERRERPTR
jgi:hypothetical protein